MENLKGFMYSATDKYEKRIIFATKNSHLGPIPKMRPSHRKGTIAHLFFGTRDLKCNGQIRTETVFSSVDTRLKNMKTNNQENLYRKLWKPWQWAWKESSSRLGANGGTVGEERHEYDWVVLELAGNPETFVLKNFKTIEIVLQNNPT